jgi:hypothetical protein
MAKIECWKKLRYFKPDSQIDKWGDTSAIDEILLYRLDDFRHWVNTPVIVTAGVQNSGHAKRSYHYKENGACAVDVVLPKYEKSAFDLILDASRFGFTGIGYYPHWKYNGETVGGLHLDTRPLLWDKDLTTNYNHSRWLGVLGADNKQRYVEMNIVNLIKYALDDTGLMNKMH